MRRKSKWAQWCAVSAALMAGCQPAEHLYYFGDEDLTYYKNVAQEVAHAHVHQEPIDQVSFSAAPHTLRDRTTDEVWDLPLPEAIHTALANNKLIRTRGQFRSPGNGILNNPAQAASIYDPAIQETGFLFGGRGVESALADFDTNFTTRMIWGRDERAQNSAGFLATNPSNTLTSETGTFDAQLQKVFANGGAFAVSQDWNYLGTNSVGTLFPSTYTGSLTANYRLPLWAGSGTEYTRIAGPVVNSFGGITGVSQGVTIARINNDITVTQFEQAVQTLVRDVEDLYWELFLAYRQYDAQIAARNSVLRTWREVKTRQEIGAAGGDAEQEAQARQNYFATRSQAEQALANLYNVEIELRRLLGLPVSDGRLIRPIDEPISAEFVSDWHVSLTEALAMRPELRRQKWQIKSLELQLTASESLTNPRLDFVSSYGLNGFGDELLSRQDNDAVGTSQGFNSAYETLTQGNQTQWGLGFEFTMPLGFRSAHAQMQNLELRLAKARSGLAASELDISHEIAVALQNIDAAYVLAGTTYNQLKAAEERLKATEDKYRAGLESFTLDLVLRAKRDLAQSEIDFYTSIVRYSQAINDLEYRKGTVLERNGVHLAEGGWTPDAYREALRRAWARSYAIPAKEFEHIETEPEPFALPGPISSPIYITNPVGPAAAVPPAPADEEAFLPVPVPAADRGIPQPGVPYDEPIPPSTRARDAAPPAAPAPAAPAPASADPTQAARRMNVNPTNDIESLLSKPASRSSRTGNGVIHVGATRAGIAKMPAVQAAAKEVPDSGVSVSPAPIPRPRFLYGD